MLLSSIRDVNLTNVKVLCRVDYNVPIEDGIVLDDTKIVRSLSTINYVLENGGYLILMSHLGRPKGVDKKYSLKPVAAHLSKLLNREVKFSSELIGSEPQSLVEGLSKETYQVILLENTRFHEGETKNDPQLAKNLSSLGDIFVSDAFGSSHRAHASTEGVTRYIPGYTGFLMEKEFIRITAATSNPLKPSLAIVGGAKVSSKLEILKNFVDVVDDVIIGGAMAFTFIFANGGNVGTSLVEEDMIDVAKEIIFTAEKNQVGIHLPIDVRVGHNFETPILENKKAKIVKSDQIPDLEMGLDIGPKSEKLFIAVIEKANTIIWNGPMGVFENELYKSGTIAVTNSIFSRSVNTIIGGGDTVYAINIAEIDEIPENIHISTGGGATLELMSGKPMPGINCLIGKPL
ncbi:MAG: phosphoglycerate kinase [Candidatus Heimdallarchaeota archaeon]|nr:phosphoglycerate kinase [Candidatus Heimdallarchaeota archaeon]